MTEIKQAILNYIGQKVHHYNHPTQLGDRYLTPEQRMLLLKEDIVIHRDGKYWTIYRKGALIAKAERRWHRTKTNPMPRELMPKFKERF